MSRPIKFRAWDNATNRWLEDTAEWLPLWRADGAECQRGDRTHKILSGACEGPGVTIEQSTGLKDHDGREIYEGDLLSWSSTGTPIPHSPSDTSRRSQRDDYVGVVTWGIVQDDEYGNDAIGWVLNGSRLHTEEGRADLRAPFEAHSLYAVVTRHAKDFSYPDSSWHMSLTACKVIGNVHEHSHILNA